MCVMCYVMLGTGEGRVDGGLQAHKLSVTMITIITPQTLGLSVTITSRQSDGNSQFDHSELCSVQFSIYMGQADSKVEY